MNSNRVKEIKKEDKKAFKSFIIIMIISAIAGGILGGMSIYFKDSLSENLPDFIMNILEAITPFASVVLSLLVIITSSIVYKKLTKELKIWNESDEEDMIDKIEEKLSYILLLSSVNLIMGFFFFGVGFALPSDYLDLNGDIVKRILFFVGFVLCVLSSILIQKKFVNLEKEINPMLKGSVYDTKFSEKWIDSCDEAIKMGIYKSSYKAYRAVTNTCLILWLVCVLGYNVWDFGIMPLFIVTTIWLVQTVAYCLESIKNSKKR
mgnify:FL=1